MFQIAIREGLNKGLLLLHKFQDLFYVFFTLTHAGRLVSREKTEAEKDRWAALEEATISQHPLTPGNNPVSSLCNNQAASKTKPNKERERDCKTKTHWIQSILWSSCQSSALLTCRCRRGSYIRLLCWTLQQLPYLTLSMKMKLTERKLLVPVFGGVMMVGRTSVIPRIRLDQWIWEPWCFSAHCVPFVWKQQHSHVTTQPLHIFKIKGHFHLKL